MSLNDRTLDNYGHPDKTKNTIFGILATRDHNMLGLGLPLGRTEHPVGRETRRAKDVICSISQSRRFRAVPCVRQRWVILIIAASPITVLRKPSAHATPTARLKTGADNPREKRYHRRAEFFAPPVFRPTG